MATEEAEKPKVRFAGFVNPDSAIARGDGFTVDKEGAGKYHVIFKKQLPSTPVVVATSDGGREGSFAHVVSTDQTGFKVEGRRYSDHGLSDIGFAFLVVILP